MFEPASWGERGAANRAWRDARFLVLVTGFSKIQWSPALLPQASRFRSGFESRLPEIFANLREARQPLMTVTLLRRFASFVK